MKILSLDTVMSSQGMQYHFGAKSANWLAGYRIVNLASNFLDPTWAEPWNEVETCCHEWSADATLNQRYSSKILKLFWCKRLTYGSLRNHSYTRMDSIWSFGNLAFNLVVWKPYLQLDQFCGQKNFLAKILKQES